MAYLLDTNVLSELRKKSRCDPQVRTWQSSVSIASCFVSVITLMEIKHGIIAATRKNTEFAAILQEWYEQQLKVTFDSKTLPITLEISERCAKLLAGRTRGLADNLIAATAFVHQLTLVTRNVADFSDTGLNLVNPWENDQ